MYDHEDNLRLLRSVFQLQALRPISVSSVRREAGLTRRQVAARQRNSRWYMVAHLMAHSTSQRRKNSQSSEEEQEQEEEQDQDAATASDGQHLEAMASVRSLKRRVKRLVCAWRDHHAPGLGIDPDITVQEALGDFGLQGSPEWDQLCRELLCILLDSNVDLPVVVGTVSDSKNRASVRSTAVSRQRTKRRIVPSVVQAQSTPRKRVRWAEHREEAEEGEGEEGDDHHSGHSANEVDELAAENYDQSAGQQEEDENENEDDDDDDEEEEEQEEADADDDTDQCSSTTASDEDKSWCSPLLGAMELADMQRDLRVQAQLQTLTDVVAGQQRQLFTQSQLIAGILRLTAVAANVQS